MDTMNKTKHSPLPWQRFDSDSLEIMAADSHEVCNVFQCGGIREINEAEANTELIITAVNERERLREALHTAVHVVRSYQHGNSAPDLADDFVSRAAALLNETMPNQPETTNTRTKGETQ